MRQILDNCFLCKKKLTFFSRKNCSILDRPVNIMKYLSCLIHCFCLLTGSVNSKVSQSSKEAENLLLNVAGKLLVFQRDRSGPQIKEKEEGKRVKPV